MEQFAYNKKLPNFKTANDPSLTVEPDNSRELGSLFSSGDNDPKLFAIFDAPEHALNSLNVLGNCDQYTPFEEVVLQNSKIKREDCSSYCTITRSNIDLEERDLMLTDFDNSSSSPNSQASKHLESSSIPATKPELECSLLDNLTFESMMATDAIAQSTPPPSGILMLDCIADDSSDTDAAGPPARPLSRVSNSGFQTKTPTTQNKSPRKSYAGEHAFKIQKPKHYQNSSSLQNLISSYNMELNYILQSDKTSKRKRDEKTKGKGKVGNSSEQNGTPAVGEVIQQQLVHPRENPMHNIFSQSLPPPALGQQEIVRPIQTQGISPTMSQSKFIETEMDCSFTSGYDSMITDDLIGSGLPRINNGKPPRSRRTKCLKKDSTVSMEKKLEYFGRIIESARINDSRGIFLRDHAASELAIKKSDYKVLELGLTNFDSIIQTLQVMTQSCTHSFRTIWKIFRQQYDHQVYLTFQLSDEYASTQEDEMEISIFTLVVPEHTPKHLMTGCQYLHLINFILGKEYNHLINDNLAETTVGSDGKMISTQKHHASRVRSHVKKYLKRHVVKDIKRYTEEERRNSSEFNYQMTLHNLVMGCSVKKPFESKVSVALMELVNVKDALTKQADFFVFKRI